MMMILILGKSESPCFSFLQAVYNLLDYHPIREITERGIQVLVDYFHRGRKNTWKIIHKKTRRLKSSMTKKRSESDLVLTCKSLLSSLKCCYDNEP